MNLIICMFPSFDLLMVFTIFSELVTIMFMAYSQEESAVFYITNCRKFTMYLYIY
jgi:hypothetical protein